MKRALAVLAAVGMVAIAVVLRSAMDDDESDGGGSSDGELVVVCATDLEIQCTSLGPSVEVRLEDPADTAAALAGGAARDDVDAWITSTAWLEVVQIRAAGALGATRAIARSPMVVATAPGRHDAITDLCAQEDVWQCLGEHAGQSWSELPTGSSSWGPLKVALGDADLAVGLPVLVSASAGYFGSTDFATNDLEQSDFESWLANLAEPSGGGESDPALTMATRQGSYSAAGDSGASVAQLESRSVESIEPVVAVAATIAVVELAGGDGAPDTDDLRDALEADGWARADEDELAPTLKPGVMAALHTLWRALTT